MTPDQIATSPYTLGLRHGIQEINAHTKAVKTTTSMSSVGAGDTPAVQRAVVQLWDFIERGVPLSYAVLEAGQAIDAGADVGADVGANPMNPQTLHAGARRALSGLFTSFFSIQNHELARQLIVAYGRKGYFDVEDRLLATPKPELHVDELTPLQMAINIANTPAALAFLELGARCMVPASFMRRPDITRGHLYPESGAGEGEMLPSDDPRAFVAYMRTKYDDEKNPDFAVVHSAYLERVMREQISRQQSADVASVSPRRRGL